MGKSVLCVDACVRQESRTRKLTEKLLGRLGGPYEEIRLEGMVFPTVNEDYLNERDRLLAAGGPFVPEPYGFGYVQALAQSYYGIQDVRKIEAVGLDIVGADVNAIMREAEDRLSDVIA